MGPSRSPISGKLAWMVECVLERHVAPNCHRSKFGFRPPPPKPTHSACASIVPIEPPGLKGYRLPFDPRRTAWQSHLCSLCGGRNLDSIRPPSYPEKHHKQEITTLNKYATINAMDCWLVSKLGASVFAVRGLLQGSCVSASLWPSHTIYSESPRSV